MNYKCAAEHDYGQLLVDKWEAVKNESAEEER